MMYKYRTIYLMLGPACNMSCKHCTQHDYLETYDLVPRKEGLREDIAKMIADIDSLGKPITVYFWGGEPLLYWETIKKTIFMLENLGVKYVQYKIQTNGLLLKQEVFDFCKNHRIEIGLSYDAPNPTALREKVPSEDIIKMFNDYDGPKHIHSSFTSENKDCVAMHKYLKEKFPNTFINIGYFIVIGEAGKTTIQFKDGEVYENISNFLKYPKGKKFREFRLRRNIFYDPNVFPEKVSPQCSHGKYSCAVDFYGNVYLCHDANIIIGKIEDGYEELEKKHEKAWLERLSPACKNCDVVEYCFCRCPMEVREGDEYASCKYFREMIHAFLDYKE